MAMLALAGIAACGTAQPVTPDAGTDAGPIELPTLPGYNHNSQIAIAARDGVVVLASMNEKLESADAFGPRLTDDPAYQRVALAVSVDRGDRFGAPAAAFPDVVRTRNPAVAVGANGTFWLKAVDGDDGGHVARLEPDVTARTAVGPTGATSWIAVDDKVGVFVVGFRGDTLLDLDGAIVARYDEQVSVLSAAVAAYVDPQARAVCSLDHSTVTCWDGASLPEQLGPAMPIGDDENAWTALSGAIGVTPESGQWIVRALRFTDRAEVVVRVRNLHLGHDGSDRPVSAPGEVALLPAAALDGAGRLHVVYYDTSGPRGVLRYTRSLTADVSRGYAPSIVLDDDACPGDGFYPYEASEDPPGGQRLREYIGIAVDGDTVHIAWTHAPEAPARVWTTRLPVDAVDLAR